MPATGFPKARNWRHYPAEQEARVARARAVMAANAANLAKAGAAVDRARAQLAQREAANRRQQSLVRRDVASAQGAEEAQRDEDVARAWRWRRQM